MSSKSCYYIHNHVIIIQSTHYYQSAVQHLSLTVGTTRLQLINPQQRLIVEHLFFSNTTIQLVNAPMTATAVILTSVNDKK